MKNLVAGNYYWARLKESSTLEVVYLASVGSYAVVQRIGDDNTYEVELFIFEKLVAR